VTKITIQGESWKVLLFEDEEFERKFEPGVAAYCDPQSKQLLFCEGELTMTTVIHELCHAYYSMLCLSSATLTNEQMEEIWCEMFAKHGKIILRQAGQLHRKLKSMS
jgi:hypothetical protein